VLIIPAVLTSWPAVTPTVIRKDPMHGRQFRAMINGLFAGKLEGFNLTG
jgi:hypothetical protein